MLSYSFCGGNNMNEDKCRHTQERDIEVLYDVSELFKVMGDSTRIRIISLLMQGEKCVLHIAQDLSMNQSAISHQLRILRTAGLVRPKREGKTVYYSLDDEHVEMIFEMGLEHVLHKNNNTKE